MTEQPKIVQPNLSAAFGGGGATERATSLEGLLPKRTTAPAATPPKATLPPPDDIPAAKPAPKVPAAKRVAVSRPTVDAVFDVGVYLDPEVVRELRARRRQGITPGNPEHTYDELLVAALVAVEKERIAATFAIESADAADGVPRRVRRPKGTGTEMIQHRLTAAQRDYLDHLAAEVGAPSRSALVNTVYTLAYSV